MSYNIKFRKIKLGTIALQVGTIPLFVPKRIAMSEKQK
jgi:hypothetical protein